MDFRNKDEGIREALDIKKVLTWYLLNQVCHIFDVIRNVKDNFKIPVLAYQVSGEYI